MQSQYNGQYVSHDGREVHLPSMQVPIQLMHMPMQQHSTSHVPTSSKIQPSHNENLGNSGLLQYPSLQSYPAISPFQMMNSHAPPRSDSNNIYYRNLRINEPNELEKANQLPRGQANLPSHLLFYNQQQQHPPLQPLQPLQSPYLNSYKNKDSYDLHQQPYLLTNRSSQHITPAHRYSLDRVDPITTPTSTYHSNLNQIYPTQIPTISSLKKHSAPDALKSPTTNLNTEKDQIAGMGNTKFNPSFRTSNLFNKSPKEASYKVEKNQNYKMKPISTKYRLSENLEALNSNSVDSYLSYYSDVSNLYENLSWATSLAHECPKFSKIIKYDTKLLDFIEKTKTFQQESDLGNYKIEEFYDYLYNYPSDNLENLEETFGKLHNLFSSWVELKRKDKKKLHTIYHFLNKSDGKLSSASSLSQTEEENKLNESNHKTKQKNLKNSAVPGEVVLLTVVPFKPNEIQDQNVQFNAQGTLQPDLSIRVKMVCQHCGSKSTPEWRKGPEDARTLCNACGLFYTKLVKRLGSEAATLELKKRRDSGEKTNRRI